MSSSNFYKAEQDDSKYDDVCDIRKKKNRTNTDVLEAFSGLECPGTELHEWESYSKQYRDKFKKAKQCVQRRITTMKKFPARSAANKTSRRKHIYPIQVAYAYGQDCLKKIASKKEQELFKDSVDELIRKISETQPNVQNYFKKSINNSIRARGNTNAIRNILNRGYYNTNQMNIINKARELGYNKLSNEDKELFLSIINEGFSRNNRYNNEFTNETNNRTDETNETPKELINTIKKDIRQRRRTKKKSISAPVRPVTNLSNLNEILQSEKFQITNNERRSDFVKRIRDIMKLFSEKLLIDEKLYMLEDVYKESFNKLNKLNKNIISTISKTAGLPLTKKTAKKSGINEKYLNKYEAYISRQKLGDDISKAHTRLIEKMKDINEKISKLLKTGNNSIDVALDDFYIFDLPKYLLQDVNYKLSILDTNEKSRMMREKDELYNLVTVVKKVNTELEEVENTLAQNLLKLAKAEELLTVPAIKNNPILLKRTEETYRELKETVATLQKESLSKYKIKTSVMLDLLQQINNKYSNPYILKSSLEKTIRLESSLISTYNKLSTAINV